jgi:hypothetical protein
VEGKPVSDQANTTGGLTPQEREFVIWALGYVEGAALEMQDDRTAYRANFIVEKLKDKGTA